MTYTGSGDMMSLKLRVLNFQLNKESRKHRVNR
nr:MAG TPA: hypothetical protein [Caudoviricetes sp.]